MKYLGIITAFFVTDFFFHIIEAVAAGLKAETPMQRLGAVFFGLSVLLILMLLFYRFFSRAFFNGFTTATGLFLSFDIVVFHWIFQLHRITNGPEANWLEPIFVVVGCMFVWFGVKRETTVQS
ncbi:DUF2243 domain-containing protein [Ammoniphilus sp. YIM 78166]|uniref:DUF2243 domain-containing protein n=1 Tax=Ammoniphilus sp. YIM 78166 TaxID=1644106 RepID=UPI00106F590D|nr:DUF2243 domain-containing protein [Ammoniphilus sp. YIM 78166]